MNHFQQIDNIDIVRLRDVPGLPHWVRDLTLVAFKPQCDGEVSDGSPSIFIVEDRQSDFFLRGRDSEMEFVPQRHDKDNRFIRGLLLAADKIRGIE